MPMGMADVATVLFKDFLNFNPKNPSWINRDRFVLSAGHGSMLFFMSGLLRFKFFNFVNARFNFCSFSITEFIYI